MSETTENDAPVRESLGNRMLSVVERVGNKLPDPTMLFIGLLGVVWILSWLLSYITYDVIDPRSGEPIVVLNQLSGTAMTTFLTNMVNTFVTFGPVGTVLVAMLGIGVAEHSGFITTGIRALLNVTSKSLLTPMVILVGIVSHQHQKMADEKGDEDSHCKRAESTYAQVLQLAEGVVPKGRGDVQAADDDADDDGDGTHVDARLQQLHTLADIVGDHYAQHAGTDA